MENKNLSDSAAPVYKIQQSAFGRLGLAIASAINRVLVFFSLRKTKQFWGIVYDSVTKQPLDPALVKLVYVDELDTQTCVTDLSGSYGFLAHPGKFKLLAKKTNYEFPSKLVAGDRDGIYENLYHGEFFELADDFEVIAPNIPMDPVGKDWNQTAKLSVFEAHPYRRYLVSRVVALFFWFGFCMALIYFWKGHFQLWSLPMNILLGYILLMMLPFMTPHDRLWGKIKQSVIFEGELILELQNPITPGVVFGKAAAQSDGKFLLRGKPGAYILQVSHRNIEGVLTVIGHTKVRIGRAGVLNSTIKIHL